MTQSSAEKIEAYKQEAETYGKMMFKGKSWDEVEPLFLDMFERIDQEPDDVKAGVAELAVNLMDKAIGIVGGMPGFAYKMTSGLIKKRLPTDMTLSKANIDKVESYAGRNVSPRVAFYFSAIKQLPDNSPDNPKQVVDQIRTAYKQFKR